MFLVNLLGNGMKQSPSYFRDQLCLSGGRERTISAEGWVVRTWMEQNRKTDCLWQPGLSPDPGQ